MSYSEVYLNRSKRLSRHTLIKSGMASVGLPLLDAMTPAFAKEKRIAKALRYVGVSLSLGFHNPFLIPETSGSDYRPSRYLKPMQDLRNDFTIISGASHPYLTGGHNAESSIFSACPDVRGATYRYTISVDQLMAKHLGTETRFPSLVLRTGKSVSSPCYTENGIMIPPMYNPRKVFDKLFVNDSVQEKSRKRELIHKSQYIMDLIYGEAKSLQRQLGEADNRKLDEWFTSIHEIDKNLKKDLKWLERPKVEVEENAPVDSESSYNIIDMTNMMMSLTKLALQTDSTRFITLHIGSTGAHNIEGVHENYHYLSHHGQDENKINQISIIDQLILKEYANFLRELKKDALLDDTMVYLTSNLGNSSKHSNKNMPAILAGGGFKHGQHLAFDQNNNYPLSDIFVNMLQQLGLPFDEFSTGKKLMRGLI